MKIIDIGGKNIIHLEEKECQSIDAFIENNRHYATVRDSDTLRTVGDLMTSPVFDFGTELCIKAMMLLFASEYEDYIYMRVEVIDKYIISDISENAIELMHTYIEKYKNYYILDTKSRELIKIGDRISTHTLRASTMHILYLLLALAANDYEEKRGETK